MAEIIAVFAGDVAGDWERAVETAAGARQAIGTCGRHKVHLRGLEYGEWGGGSVGSGSIG